MVHWHSFVERLHSPDDSVPRPACGLPAHRGDLVVADIRDVQCERCRLKHGYEMSFYLRNLRNNIRQGGGKQ